MNQRSTTVLPVEDDEHIAERVVFGLQAEGFSVIRAIDDSQSLETARPRARTSFCGM